MEILKHLKNVSSDDARKAIQRLTLCLKNVLLDLNAAQEVMLTAGRYVTNETSMDHLQTRSTTLRDMSTALKWRLAHFSANLIEDIRAGKSRWKGRE